MKTIYALFSSALATVIVTLIALIATACSRTTAAYEEPIPVVPTTLVYSIDGSGGFDREAIANRTNKPTTPETYQLDGKESTISLSEAFDDMDDQDEFITVDYGSGYVSNGMEISVVEAVTCHGVEGHSPVDESTYFQPENGRVWLYTQIAMPEGSSGLIQHVWKYKGEVKQRIELFVQGPTYRTASSKMIDPAMKGDWTVEIATENGEVLDVAGFQVL